MPPLAAAEPSNVGQRVVGIPGNNYHTRVHDKDGREHNGVVSVTADAYWFDEAAMDHPAVGS